MALKLKCDACGHVLKEPGALVFSPPDQVDHVRKLHICIQCFERLYQFIEHGLKNGNISS